MLPLNQKLSAFFQAPSAFLYHSVASGFKIEVATFSTFVSLETTLLSPRGVT